METEGNREHFARYFIRANDRRVWRHDSSLYVERADPPLARRLVLCLLSDHRPGFLVAVHVLAGSASGWRTDSVLLASLVWRGLHALNVLDVQDVAQGHGRSEEHTSELQSLRHLV